MPSEGNGREIVGTNRARTAEGSRTKRKKIMRRLTRQTKNWVLGETWKRQQIEIWATNEGVLDPARGMYLHFLHLE